MKAGPWTRIQRGQLRGTWTRGADTVFDLAVVQPPRLGGGWFVNHERLGSVVAEGPESGQRGRELADQVLRARGLLDPAGADR